jgi:hypothetical protein
MGARSTSKAANVWAQVVASTDLLFPTLFSFMHYFHLPILVLEGRKTVAWLETKEKPDLTLARGGGE